MSSSYVSVGDGGPESVMDVALRVQAAGDDFKGTAQSLRQAIEDVEATHPWGANDQYAHAFLEQYAGKGGRMATNDAVKQGITDAADTLSHLGSNVVEAMAKYAATETENATGIGSVGGGA
jgi:hypothetical protein